MSDLDGVNKGNEEKNTDNSKKINEYERKDEFNKTRTNWPAWIQAISAIALVVFTFFLTHYSSRAVRLTGDSVKISRETLESAKAVQDNTLAEMKAQSKAMQDSADAIMKSVEMAARGIAISEKNVKLIEEQFRIEQRPWIQVKDVKLENELEANKTCRFNLTMVNDGKTPAQHVKFTVTFRDHVHGKTYSKTFPGFTGGSISIGPRRSVSQPGSIDAKVVKQEIIDGIKSGTHVFEITLEVTYKDIFDSKKWYRTGYCGFYVPVYGLEFLTCKEGNYME